MCLLYKVWSSDLHIVIRFRVISQHMSLKCIDLSVSSITNVTNIWLFFCMYDIMSLQIEFGSEGFAAHATLKTSQCDILKWFHTGIHFYCLESIRLLFGVGPRVGVLILVYCSDMNFHCVMLRKTSFAYFTNVGFFFCMNNIMPFKHIFISKAFETDFTLVASCSLNKIVLKSRNWYFGFTYVQP